MAGRKIGALKLPGRLPRQATRAQQIWQSSRRYVSARRQLAMFLRGHVPGSCPGTTNVHGQRARHAAETLTILAERASNEGQRAIRLRPDADAFAEKYKRMRVAFNELLFARRPPTYVAAIAG